LGHIGFMDGRGCGSRWLEMERARSWLF
jgi:hypothetical protein